MYRFKNDYLCPDHAFVFSHFLKIKKRMTCLPGQFQNQVKCILNMVPGMKLEHRAIEEGSCIPQILHAILQINTLEHLN